MMMMGWILALIVSGVAVTLGLKLQESQAQVEIALHREEVLRKELDELICEQLIAKTQADDMNKQLAEKTFSLEQFKAMTVKPTQKSEETNTTAMSRRSDPVSSHDEQEGGGAQEFFKGLSHLFNGEQGEAMAKMSAEMGMNMQYGRLFKDLNLSPDTTAQVSASISKYMVSQMQASLQMLSSNKVDQARMVEEQIAAEKLLRGELAMVLNVDELAMYDNYQKEMPRNTLEINYDLQLKMSGSAMKPESCDLVKQVLVEEVLKLIPDYGQPTSASSWDPQSALQSQLVAIAHARERLHSELDAEEFALANHFFNQQEAQVQMSQELFDGGVFHHLQL
jgi:hypothetical protein